VQNSPASSAGCSNLLELLRLRASETPARRAFTFLGDVTGQAKHLTYGELDRQARAVGALLQRQAPAGSRALLLHPPGLDFISALFGCIYAGVIAVPACPPRPGRGGGRLRSMARDCAPATVLSTALGLAKADPARDLPELVAVPWLATDGITGTDGSNQRDESDSLDALEALAAEWREPRLARGGVALLQYTSGSTTDPKGVMVGHAGLMYNLASTEAGRHGSESVVVTWLPTYHDMGLICGVLQPLFQGILGVLMSPASFLQRPIRWLQAITELRGTHTIAPNFAFDLCVAKIGPVQRRELDLRSLEVCVCGAEPVRSQTLRSFSAAFADCGFRSSAFAAGYGLAEATLQVALGGIGSEPTLLTVDAEALAHNRALVVEALAGDAAGSGSGGGPKTATLVGCGKPLPDTAIAIVDPERLVRCLPGAVGEIWVSGNGVALGYWDHPAATEETFRAHLVVPGSSGDGGEGPFLRTGDLGFILGEELYVTGRLKDIVLIDGRNHYPQDIELTVEGCDPFLQAGGSAAFSVDDGREERLVVVAEISRHYHRGVAGLYPVPPLDLVSKIRREVAAEHELNPYRVVLVKPATLLKTTSGKVRRRACRDAFLAGTLEPLEA
jgi:acyl-CoA synthetase (AMP-forming)/AMP-acid ligase II